MSNDDEETPTSRVGYEELRGSSAAPDLVLAATSSYQLGGSPDVDLDAVVAEAEAAVDEGVAPTLIRAGSSGSYLVCSRARVSATATAVAFNKDILHAGDQ